jgi:hypothetical protein
MPRALAAGLPLCYKPVLWGLAGKALRLKNSALSPENPTLVAAITPKERDS